jgi:magnesium-transporting ATPase (P-type)
MSVSGLLGNPVLFGVIGVVIFLQLLFTLTAPFQLLFESRTLDVQTWVLIGLAGAALFLIVELEKGLRRWLLRRA